MSNGKLQTALQHLRRIIGSRLAADESDGHLLDQFVRCRDEAAFTELVRRHGPMVLAVCNRVLQNSHAAEDAFQAAFLVLAKKAASIRNQHSVASWLCRVAHHLALAARGSAARRAAHERHVTPMAHAEAASEQDRHEMQTLLDEEVQRLPAKLHAPVVLCYLEGKTYEEAAHLLRWPLGTVKKRLGQARDRLRERLGRHGTVATVLLVASLLEQNAPAAVPGTLLDTTVQAALHIASGKTLAASAASAPAIALAERMMTSMFALKVKLAAAMVLAVTAVGMGAGLVARHSLNGIDRNEATSVADKDVVPVAQGDAAPTDMFGDPLPGAALARLGSLRFRHNGPVTCMAFTPDGKTIVSGSSQDKALHFWDPATGKELRRLEHPDGGLRAVSLDRDGKRVAVAGSRSIIVWEIATGKEIGRFPSQSSGRYCSVALSPDGRTLVSAGGHWWMGWLRTPRAEDLTLRVHSVATGRVLLQVTEQNIHALAFSPDGKTLASGHHDGVRLWEMATLKQRAVLSKDCPRVEALTFSPDGTTLAASSSDQNQPRKTILWDLATQQGRTLPHGCWSLAFSPDGTTLAGTTNGVRTWEVTSGKELRVLVKDRPGIRHVAFGRDNRTLAVASYNVLQVWDAVEGKQLRPMPGHDAEVGRFAWSPDGQTLASASNDATVRLWDVASRTQRLVLTGDLDRIMSLAFSPDGHTVAASTVNNPRPGTVVLWNTRTGKVIRTLPAQLNGATRIKFSPDGTILAAASVADGETILWDAVTGRKLHGLRGGDFFGFTPDSKLIVYQGADYCPRRNARLTIHVCEIGSGKELQRFDDPEGFYPMALSPDGKSVAAVSGDFRVVHQWDLASGKELRRIEAPKATAFSPFWTFPPDGRLRLQAGAEKPIVRLWDAASGKDARYFAEQQDYMNGPRLSPDGRFCAIPAEDQSATVWDLAADKEWRKFTGRQGRVLTVAFSPNSRTLVTGGQDGTTLLWDLYDTHR